ncbi:Heterokaryon incompatibility protein [Paramyrothecium foliicola]|nr:Heterokaryon incompatibility protein [Paramyrothecium foliicola]
MNRETLYQPLSTDDESIRLLEILPALVFSTPVQGRLFTASLQSNPAPTFEALSYVWGAPELSATIDLGAVKCGVTKGLDIALRRIRKRRHSRVVWVDQICINQNDLEERGRQVLLMGKLYSRADRVLAWLGDDLGQDFENMIASLPHWLIGLRNDRSMRNLCLTASVRSPSTAISRASYLLSGMIPSTRMRLKLRFQESRQVTQLHMALIRFDEIAYWSRMWVLQEFTLAKQPPLLMLGSLILSKEFLETVVWARSEDGLLKKMAQPLERALSEKVVTKSNKAEVLQLKDDVAFINGAASLLIAFTPQGGNASGDYTGGEPVINLSRTILTLYGWRVDVIRDVFGISRGSEETQLDRAWECAELSGQIACQSSLVRLDYQLLARNPSKLADLLNEIRDVIHTVDPGRRYVTSEGQDINDKSSASSQDKIQSVCSLICGISLSKQYDEITKYKARMIEKRVGELEDSILFCTSLGFMGVAYAPQKVQKGDVVAVLCGLDYPYVLRPQGCEWGMVGSIYLSGIMNGELVNYLREKGDLDKLEAFTIT